MSRESNWLALTQVFAVQFLRYLRPVLLWCLQVYSLNCRAVLTGLLMLPGCLLRHWVRKRAQHPRRTTMTRRSPARQPRPLLPWLRPRRVRPLTRPCSTDSVECVQQRNRWDRPSLA